MENIAHIQAMTVLASASSLARGHWARPSASASSAAASSKASARQPELGPTLLARMFIVAGLLDAVAFIGIALRAVFHVRESLRFRAARRFPSIETPLRAGRLPGARHGDTT